MSPMPPQRPGVRELHRSTDHKAVYYAPFCFPRQGFADFHQRGVKHLVTVARGFDTAMIDADAAAENIHHYHIQPGENRPTEGVLRDLKTIKERWGNEGVLVQIPNPGNEDYEHARRMIYGLLRINGLDHERAEDAVVNLEEFHGGKDDALKRELRLIDRGGESMDLWRKIVRHGGQQVREG